MLLFFQAVMQADYRALILNPCFKINLSLLKDILSLSMIASIQFITTVLVCLFPCFFFPIGCVLSSEE